MPEFCREGKINRRVGCPNEPWESLRQNPFQEPNIAYKQDRAAEQLFLSFLLSGLIHVYHPYQKEGLLEQKCLTCLPSKIRRPKV